MMNRNPIANPKQLTGLPLVDRGIGSIGIGIVILAGCILGSLVSSSPGAALCVSLGWLLFGLLAHKPLHLVGVLIVVAPLASAPLLHENLFSAPGSKPFHLLALLVAGVAAWNLPLTRPVPRHIIIFTVLFTVLFSLCVLRGVSAVEFMNFDGKPQTTTSYLLSYWIKPLIFLLPFVVIPLYCRTVDDLEMVVSFLIAATLGLAGYSLYLYLTCNGDFGAMSEAVAEQTGLHRNSVSSLLMVGFPFLIARYILRKSVLSVVAIVATAAAICVLFSRTAYVTLALSPVLYAFVSKRAKAIPTLVVVVLGLAALMPLAIWERGSKGLDSGDLNEILANRVNHIWLPLLDEYLADSSGLVFGRGRFAMLSSDAMQRGSLMEAKHPHNFYLELLIDTGLVGLCFALTFLAIILGPVVTNRGRSSDVRLREYSYASLVSTACYLIAGLTGRSMFPENSSSFFWVVLAIAVVIGMLCRAENHEHPPGELAVH